MHESSQNQASDRQLAFHIMTKPVGPICNLDCKYCFYLEKENLYPRKSSWEMPAEVLESYIRQYIEAQNSPTVSFAWQAGEPTLLGVAYWSRVSASSAKRAAPLWPSSTMEICTRATIMCIPRTS